jgi:hypothetical protein
VDRLSALVLLRVKTELRAMSFAKERMLGALVALPGMLLSSLLVSAFALFGLRAVVASRPESLLPIVSGIASGLGLLWSLAPLLSGIALAESHDMSRLLHFPIPLRELVASSLLANFLQPAALMEAPFLLAVAAGLSRSAGYFPLVLLGLLLSFVLSLAAAQAVGLLVHGLARNRRFHDAALFLGLLVGVAMSVLPMLVLVGGAQALRPLLALGRVLGVLPFAWGARAAVYAGRGELLPFLGWGAAGGLAVALVMGASARLIQLVYRGELDLGVAPGGATARARLVLPGALGALLEKDLRSSWRDPGTRAGLILSLLGPALVLFFLTQSRVGTHGYAVLFLASYVGASAFGSNALGFERRGLGLLLLFPVPRWRVLVGKNLSALLFRMPGFLTLLVALFVAGSAAIAPAALAIALSTFLIAAGVDNFFSILFPIAAPAPGRHPQAQSAGGRGLGSALLSSLFLTGALLLSAPFALLAWLPLLLGTPRLWLVTLPLALAGALALYALLIGVAARLFERREPDMLERVLGEA